MSERKEKDRLEKLKLIQEKQRRKAEAALRKVTEKSKMLQIENARKEKKARRAAERIKKKLRRAKALAETQAEVERIARKKAEE